MASIPTDLDKFIGQRTRSLAYGLQLRIKANVRLVFPTANRLHVIYSDERMLYTPLRVLGHRNKRLWDHALDGNDLHQLYPVEHVLKAFELLRDVDLYTRLTPAGATKLKGGYGYPMMSIPLRDRTSK